jgi:hypothetical protein
MCDHRSTGACDVCDTTVLCGKVRIEVKTKEDGHWNDIIYVSYHDTVYKSYTFNDRSYKYHLRDALLEASRLRYLNDTILEIIMPNKKSHKHELHRALMEAKQLQFVDDEFIRIIDQHKYADG